MNEYLLYALIGLGLLLIALIIPGVKTLAEFMLKGLGQLFLGAIQHKGTFLIFFIKKLAASHARLLEHATTDRDTIDPTQRARRASSGYDD